VAVIKKKLEIPATPEEVFDLIASVEKFPLFFSNIKSVHKTGTDKYRFNAQLAGVPISWEGRVANVTRPARFAWESTKGIKNRGCFEIEATTGGSQVTMLMEYELSSRVASVLLSSISGVFVDKVVADALSRIRDYFLDT
jgi:uncharacterized membrane protein